MSKSKRRDMVIRIILDLCILVAIFQGWWFVAMVVAFVGAWRYDYFIEVLIAGVVYDGLFGVSGVQAHRGLISGVALFFVIQALKRIVRK